jgi:glycosyltransferase involved in cell wall biosynthesis
MAKEILFISHDASRTGAPILLLNFLKWLKANTDIPFRILFRAGGELEPEFRAVASTMVLQKQVTLTSLPARILRRFKIVWYTLTSAGHTGFLYSHTSQYGALRRFLSSTGLIYSNTAANGDVLEALSPLGCPVISHIHELEHSLRECRGLEKVIRYTNQYIACSEAVKTSLVENQGIQAQKIETIHEFIPLSGQTPQRDRRRIFDELGIPHDAGMVCASGTNRWRKSPELFLQLAACVNRKLERPAFFIWVGETGDETGLYRLMYDVKKLGLEKRVLFIGEKADPSDYFAACDVFVQVSREDPFPLVCLEAALLAKPIVCFDKAGGMKEFVEEDAGFVVPYLDIEVFASKVVDLLNSPELRGRLGGRAQEKVRERHNIDISAQKILKVINRTASG